MTTWKKADKAKIGYKIMKGDWIVMELPCGATKQFRVTRTTGTRAFVKRSGRNEMKFPRYYSLPFIPLGKKTKPEYESPNKWYVKMNEDLSRLRLRYEES